MNTRDGGKVLRAPGNYDVDQASRDTSLAMVFDTGEIDVGLTQQEFKDECDINEIVRRFGLTGSLPEVVNVPRSGDFTGVVDFQTALNAVRKAEEGFMALPADLRARFGNDPQRLMAFMDDGNNLEEARKLGLVNPPPEKTRDVVQAVDELAKSLAPPGDKK